MLLVFRPLHAVIPAKAGIQAPSTDIREPGPESRLRGNDADEETSLRTIQ